MAKILLAWELGAHRGHLGPLSVLGRELKARGHEPTFVLRSLRHAEEFLGRHGCRYMQAPLSRTVFESKVPPISYSEVLHRAGFLDPEGLLTVLKAWRGLFELVVPDAIVLDYAPAAALAARGMGIPCALYGAGFSSPPRVSPFPGMQPWLMVPEEYLQQSDHRVLACVNRALRALAEKPLERLCEMLEVEEDLLCTFPELDHYPSRGAAQYYGPAFADDLGQEPQWGANGGSRVFGYLHPDTPNLETLLAQLSALDHEFLWVVPGVTPELRLKFEKPGFRFSGEMFKLARVVQQCDVAVTNGGHGTTAAFLLGGVPLLMLPRHVEQYLVARNVNRLGAGLLIEHSGDNADYQRTLVRLTDTDACALAAEAFAHKYSAFNPQRQAAAVAEKIERLAK